MLLYKFCNQTRFILSNKAVNKYESRRYLGTRELALEGVGTGGTGLEGLGLCSVRSLIADCSDSMDSNPSDRNRRPLQDVRFAIDAIWLGIRVIQGIQGIGEVNLKLAMADVKPQKTCF